MAILNIFPPQVLDPLMLQHPRGRSSRDLDMHLGTCSLPLRAFIGVIIKNAIYAKSLFDPESYEYLLDRLCVIYSALPIVFLSMSLLQKGF